MGTSLLTTCAKNVSHRVQHAVVDLIAASHVMEQAAVNLHIKSNAIKIAQLDQLLTLNL